MTSVQEVSYVFLCGNLLSHRTMGNRRRKGLRVLVPGGANGVYEGSKRDFFSPIFSKLVSATLEIARWLAILAPPQKGELSHISDSGIMGGSIGG